MCFHHHSKTSTSISSPARSRSIPSSGRFNRISSTPTLLPNTASISRDLKFHPSVVSAWGDDVLILPVKSKLIRYYTKKALAAADRIYAVSHDIRNHIIVDFGIPESKVRYLPFGIDTDLFSLNPVAEKKSNGIIEIFSNRGFYPVYDNETLVRGFAKACKSTGTSVLHSKVKGQMNRKSEISFPRLAFRTS